MEEATEGAYPAVRWDVVIEVSSHGGDTTGYQIPFTLHYTGARAAGMLSDPSKKTFTEASA